MSVEAGVLVATSGSPIHWHAPHGRSAGFLPEGDRSSHEENLWDVIWRNRGIVRGFAHSHPGHGMPGPSGEDRTSFRDIELGLGRRLSWWITSRDVLILVRWVGPGDLDYGSVRVPSSEEPPWVGKLRELSFEGK